MSSILDQALGESQRRADRMVEHALSSHQGGGRKAPNAVWRQPAATSPASAPGVLGGMVSGLTGLGSQQQQAMFHHREQMRHYAGWVYSCIRPIAQRIAGQAVRVARGKKKAAGKKGGSKPQKDLIPRNIKTLTDDMDVLEQHPLLDAINNPNAIMVRWILLYVTVVYLELTGRAFWWIRKREQDPGNKASPAPAFEIWPLPPSWVEPVHEEDKLYASWRIRPEGSAEAVSVPGEEIVQIYYPDPSNPLGCIAPLQAQSRAVVADEAIVEAQRRSFQNGLHFGALITVGRHPDVPGVPGARPILSREQRAQIVSAIKQFYRGVVHHDEPLILDGLIENVQRFTQTPREMDYQTSGKLTKERISQGFGVNPIIMGQVEGANRASSASADDHFCFLPGESAVLTEHGCRPVERHRDGSRVLTHKGRWQPARRIGREYTGYVTRIHVDGNNRPVRCTEDHWWLVRNPSGLARRMALCPNAILLDDITAWLPAGAIRRDDQLGFPVLPVADTELPIIKVSDYIHVKPLSRANGTVMLYGTRWSKYGLPAQIPVTDACAWAIGLYLAEGHQGVSQAVWSLHREEHDLFVPRLNEWMTELGLKPCCYSRNGVNAIQVRGSSVLLARLLGSLCGDGAGNKIVPPAVFSWPDRLKRQVIAGYFYGDAAFDKGRCITATSVSKSLILGMRALLASVGIPSTMREDANEDHEICGRTVAGGPFWQLGVHSGTSLLVKEIPEFANKKQGGAVKSESASGFIWWKVQSAEREDLPYAGMVYNLQVEEDESFVTAHGVTHNCSSTVNPKIELISECLTAWLAPRFSAPGEKLLIYLEPASAYDPDLELSRQRFLQSIGALSINEARAANGYPPIEGGDVCLISDMLMPVSVTREGEGGISFLKPVDPDKPPAQGGNGGGGAGGDGQDPASADQGSDDEIDQIDDPLAGKGGKK